MRPRVALHVKAFPTVSQTFIYNKAVALERNGIDVTMLCLNGRNDPAFYADWPRFGGAVKRATVAEGYLINVSAIARATPGSARFLPAARRVYGPTARAARAAILAASLTGFDLVHFEFSEVAVRYLDALPLLNGQKIVVSCRGYGEQIRPLADPLRADELRTLFTAAHRVHCVSEDMQRTCEGYGLDAAKAFVNRPAVDPERFRRRSPYRTNGGGPLSLLTVSRLHWKKGIEYALLAVRELLSRGVDVHYHVVGDGKDLPRLRLAQHDLGLESHVTFHGRLDAAGVREQLELADVFLLPSTSEGIANVVLEAMAMEVPVVSTDAGGMAEAITHGVDGMLVRSRDQTAIADAVAGLAADPARRTALGASGRRTIVERFPLDAQTDRVLEVYRELIGC